MPVRQEMMKKAGIPLLVLDREEIVANAGQVGVLFGRQAPDEGRRGGAFQMQVQFDLE